MNPFRSFGKPSSSSFSLNAVWVTQHHQSTKKTASGGLSKQIQPIQHRADGSSRWCSSSYWCYAMYLRLLSSFLHLTLPPAHTFGEPLLRVLPYCRTAGLPYCRTVVLSYCRACKQHGPVERASSVHREDEAGWGIGYSSEAVAGRAGPSWGQAPLAVFGVPFCCCEMLHKRDKVPGKDAFRRPSRRVDFAKLCAKSPQSPQYGLNSSSFAVASSPY